MEEKLSGRSAGPASRAIDGLWLRGPDEYFADALPRARAFLDRFPSPAERGRAAVSAV